MRRRKQNRKAVRDVPAFPTPLALVLATVIGLAFGYLWLRDRCDVMGRRLQDLEAKRDEVRHWVTREEAKWSQMKSPARLQQLIAQFQLPLVWPGEGYTVRLRRPELEPEGPAEALYAQRTASGHE